jgi:hypothetical protein
MRDFWDSGPHQDAGPGAANAFTLLARWHYSLAAFYFRRWQRQMELPLRLAQSASPADLVEARRAFEEDLVADYADQAEALHQTCHDRLPSPQPETSYGAELLRAQEDARQLLDQAKAQAERIIAGAHARASEIVAEAAGKGPPGPHRRSANA